MVAGMREGHISMVGIVVVAMVVAVIIVAAMVGSYDSGSHGRQPW